MSDTRKKSSDLPLDSFTRRNFLRRGAVAGIGSAAALTGLTACERGESQHWDLEFDVVVIGSGAAGLPAAIAARDNGASVLLVEKNWDVGGRAIVSVAAIQLGCGNALQRDAGIVDTPDQFFLDWTGSDGQAAVDPDRWGNMGHPLAKYNDREIVRAFADNAVATFDFLTENGVRWDGLRGIRGPGDIDVPRQTMVLPWPEADGHIIKGRRGTGLIRPLERSARRKGVEILLQHRMTGIVRERPDAGPVIGITADAVDRWNKPLGPSLRIRARRGIIVATGGHSGNVNFRRMYDPRLTEEYQVWADAVTTKDGDGEIAAMAIGASLWTMAAQTNEGDRQIDRAGGNIGTLRNGSPWIPPDSQLFFRQVASGLVVRNWQDAILVKETGRRFAEETLHGKPMGSPGWRAHIDAALQWTGDPAKLNGGGPVWAIFDAAAVAREGWQTEPPYVDREGGYFFSADTLEELASQVIRCPFQWRAMPGDSLVATVDRYNSFVDSGVDADFGKPIPAFRIEKPPFHAAWATPVCHDVMSGLRINANAEVLDMQGAIIPGLYAAGESASGIALHGIGKSALFGRLAGQHVAARMPID
jgi:hypothetical protein